MPEEYRFQHLAQDVALCSKFYFTADKFYLDNGMRTATISPLIIEGKYNIENVDKKVLLQMWIPEVALFGS